MKNRGKRFNEIGKVIFVIWVSFVGFNNAFNTKKCNVICDDKSILKLSKNYIIP